MKYQILKIENLSCKFNQEFNQELWSAEKEKRLKAENEQLKTRIKDARSKTQNKDEERFKALTTNGVE